MRTTAALWVVFAALTVGAVPACALDTTTPSQEPDASTKDTITLTIAIIGAITGILGAGLSAYNTYVAREARKVNLRVVPGWNVAPGYTAFSIEVVNLSTVAVIVDQIGFLEHGTKRTLPLINPLVADGGVWPRKLGPHEAVSVHLDPNDLPIGIRLGRAFAQTTSDERGTGTSEAHKQLARLVSSGTLAVPALSCDIPSRTVRSINVLPGIEAGRV